MKCPICQNQDLVRDAVMSICPTRNHDNSRSHFRVYWQASLDKFDDFKEADHIYYDISKYNIHHTIYLGYSHIYCIDESDQSIIRGFNEILPFFKTATEVEDFLILS